MELSSTVHGTLGKSRSDRRELRDAMVWQCVKNVRDLKDVPREPYGSEMLQEYI